MKALEDNDLPLSYLFEAFKNDVSFYKYVDLVDDKKKPMLEPTSKLELYYQHKINSDGAYYTFFLYEILKKEKQQNQDKYAGVTKD